MRSPLLRVALVVLAAFFGSFSILPATSPAGGAVPVNLNLKVQKRTVAVSVAAGVSQVVLERRAGSGWKPLGVSYPGSARVVSFTLASVIPASELRAIGYRGLKFPSRFLRGKRAFEREDPTAAVKLEREFVDGTVAYSMANSLGVVAANAGGPATETAVESDIWQIVGNKVFFFNQYRGLQILDLADPLHPVRTGNLRLPASGEQMFVLDATGSAVVLLGRSNKKDHTDQATVWLIRVTDGDPEMVAEVPLEGTISDSRLIGTKLHLLRQVVSEIPAVAGLVWPGWSSRTVLTSIELADIAAPKILGNVEFSGSPSALQAAGGYLLVASGEDNASRVHVVDVTEAPVLVKSLTPRGWVQDKFSMDVVNGAVVVVSLVRPNWSERQTWVETFPLAGDGTDPLASMELAGARNEQLHATRFDGPRLYVVTFRSIDPLFVVDLTDPANPVLSGSLEVPGWSTYLEPLGNRLLAVGVENNRVTVSLFDVTDVTAPKLAARLPLGPEGSTSWSEANYDEKAVEYLPALGLLMVPFETWDSGSGGLRKAVQVVQVGTDTLSAGATIRHDFDPRRGSWIAGHYVTISGQELLVHGTDPAGSGDPEAAIPLAWRTDRVAPLGDLLLQVEDGSYAWWGGWFLVSAYGSESGRNARVRVSPAIDPDNLLDLIDLGPGRVVAMTVTNGVCYLAQWVPSTDTTPQRLRTLALGLDASSNVAVLGDTSHDLTGLSESRMNLDGMQALWTEARTLVWFLPMQSQQWWWGETVSRIVPSASITPSMIAPLWAGPQPVASPVPVAAPSNAPVFLNPTALFCPVSVADSGLTPGAVLQVTANGRLCGTSRAFDEGGFIFFSYDLAVEKKSTAAQPAPLLSPYLLDLSFYYPTPATTSRVASWLQVLDWRAGSPVFRSPVSIPGQLLSVAQADAQGAVLLTKSGQRLKGSTAPARSIQASGYDGVCAWLLDSLATTTSCYAASATDGTRIFLADESAGTGVIGIGYDPTSGKLVRSNAWKTTVLPQMLHVTGGQLLASSYGTLEMAAIDPATGTLTPNGSFDTPTNLWLLVDRSFVTPESDIWMPAADYGVEFFDNNPD